MFHYFVLFAFFFSSTVFCSQSNNQLDTSQNMGAGGAGASSTNFDNSAKQIVTIIEPDTLESDPFEKNSYSNSNSNNPSPSSKLNILLKVGEAKRRLSRSMQNSRRQSIASTNSNLSDQKQNDALDLFGSDTDNATAATMASNNVQPAVLATLIAEEVATQQATVSGKK